MFEKCVGCKLKSTYFLYKKTKETLTKMPSDQSFDHFYANVSCKSEGLLGEPMLPRKQGGWTGGLEVGASAPTYPQIANDHFRRVY